MTPTNTILFHLQTYFQLGHRMNRLPFLAMNLLFAFLMTVFLMPMLPEAESVEEMMTDMPFVARFAVEAYSLLLIPAFIKRMKDLDWTPRTIEIALALVYVPAVLKVFLSDAMFAVFIWPISLAGGVFMVMNFYMFLAEGTTGPNRYGDAPSDGE